MTISSTTLNTRLTDPFNTENKHPLPSDEVGRMQYGCGPHWAVYLSGGTLN